jgi:Putative beta barrel porin-7 (BBP7)
MRKGFFTAVGAMVLGGTAALGQTPPTAAPEKAAPLAAAPAWPGPGYEADSADAAGQLTFSADYLLWWVRKGPSAGPLLTVGSPSDTIPGALGQPGTRSLFGDDGFNYHTFSGLRLNGGIGLTSGLALEGNYFVLERRSVGFSAASDAGGNPLIARPVINDHNGLEESYSTSTPGNIAGSTDIVTHTQLQGYEINLAATVARGEAGCLDLLAGYRYLDLREDLLFHDALTPLVPNYLTFDGGAVNPPSTLGDFDGFRTRNHFYGGQVGARWQGTFGPLAVSALAKVALGATEQRAQVEGASALLTPGAAAVVAPGGILALPSNGGSYSHSAFSVVPEFGLNLGWQVTPWLTANVGYTFLYWSDVARPGAQIDRRVSPFAVPTDQNFGMGSASGHPAFGFQSSDFWAQGLNFGVAVRF